MVAPPLQWGRDRGELRSFSFTERVMLGSHLAKVSAFRTLQSRLCFYDDVLCPFQKAFRLRIYYILLNDLIIFLNLIY